MRRSTTVLALIAIAALFLTGCSGSHIAASASAPTASQGHRATAPLSSAALSRRLLDERDLGAGYTRIAPRPAQRDDVTVTGCPALTTLGADAATGATLTSPRKARATFRYAGNSGSEVSEELYSDDSAKLSSGIQEIVDAMVSCPTYQVVEGSHVIDISTQKLSAPKLGDERWSLQLTYSAAGQRTIVKQTAIRTGSTLRSSRARPVSSTPTWPAR